MEDLKAKLEKLATYLHGEVADAKAAGDEQPTEEFIRGMEHMVTMFDKLTRDLRN